MAKFNCVVLMAIVAAAIGMVSAISDEEKKALRGMVIPILAECGKEFKITKEEVLAAKESHNIDALNPCYYACFFKKVGVMTDEGLYDFAAAEEQHKKIIHGEEDLKKLQAITDTCAKVNDETVSDGAAGCERAKLLVRCMVENKATISPLDA